MRRRALVPASVIVRTILINDRGFELYESSTTLKPAAKSKTSPRIRGGLAVLNAPAICAGGISKQVATAAAASAFIRLCRPLIGSVARASPNGVLKRNLMRRRWL